MQIVQLDPAEVTDADVAAVHALRAAATATDAPQDPPRPLEEVALRLRNSRPDRRRLHVLARHGGTLAGYASLTLPELDNTHLGQVELAVHPESRRRGAGTALLREVARIAAAEGRRTEVLVPRAEPHQAYQEDTAVVPAHRGRGLGLWVKADMLGRLRAERPEVAEIDTSNSASNRHMFAVNDRLGFRPRSAAHNWQGDVADLVSHPGVSLRAPARASTAASTPEPTVTPNAARPPAASTT